MDLSLQGRLTKILPRMSGVSKSGKEWKKQTFVIELQDGAYTQEVAFDVMGERQGADVTRFPIGSLINVKFDVRSHEYNGKYFTNINAWAIDAVGGAVNAPSPAAAAPAPAQPAAPVAPNFSAPATSADKSAEDDLPF